MEELAEAICIDVTGRVRQQALLRQCTGDEIVDVAVGVTDAGAVLAGAVERLMQAIAMPNGVGGVGYTAADIDDLVAGTLPQQRLLGNAPCELPRETLAALFSRALRYW